MERRGELKEVGSALPFCILGTPRVNVVLPSVDNML